MKRLHSFGLFSVIFAVALAHAGCGPSTVQFRGTRQAIGVDGKAELHDIEGGNTEVRVELQHLPPPSRLGAGLTEYAMWIIPQGGNAQLAGFLAYDEGERKGTGRATTPGRRFQLRVTAERNRTVGAPSQHVVAETRVSR